MKNYLLLLLTCLLIACNDSSTSGSEAQGKSSSSMAKGASSAEELGSSKEGASSARRVESSSSVDLKTESSGAGVSSEGTSALSSSSTGSGTPLYFNACYRLYTETGASSCQEFKVEAGSPRKGMSCDAENEFNDAKPLVECSLEEVPQFSCRQFFDDYGTNDTLYTHHWNLTTLSPPDIVCTGAEVIYYEETKHLYFSSSSEEEGLLIVEEGSACYMSGAPLGFTCAEYTTLTVTSENCDGDVLESCPAEAEKFCPASEENPVSFSYYGDLANYVTCP